MSGGCGGVLRARSVLEEAESLERAGYMEEARARAEAAVELAGEQGDRETLARALRRLAVLRHHDGDAGAALALCRRSHEVARSIGSDLLAAEALNVEAGLEFEAGRIEEARRTYTLAAALGGEDAALRARVEQNLGILANIQGELEAASSHYRRSLDAYTAQDDPRGRGLVLHNLGMLQADRERWNEADACFRQSRQIAEELGDRHLAALCDLNHSEVHLARQHYDRARESAEAALTAFDRIGSRLDKSDAYRVLGVVYRETGRHTLAEARLRAACQLAAGTGSTLSEAEATRELAFLHQAMGRNQEALGLLHTAYRLFSRLDARLDLVDVVGKRERLEATYLSVVRGWGQSIESADTYTFGHCERVAGYALAVARALGLEEPQLTTIRVGAYLHDVGKIRVPHEILNKAGRLTDAEFGVIRQHPVWGVELLDGVEFPWDIKPIIRWHHEKYDGTGYPDGLRGEEIPLGAQILCIADVYDAMTTTRSYRAAMSHEQAVAEMDRSRHWWHPRVLAAFKRAVPGGEPLALQGDAA